MNDVTANNRTIVHRGDGLTNVAALPDVCKTPTPAGPAPIPYPNIAREADLAKGAKSVKIAGNPVGHANSEISRSSGDEPGTIGGLISNTNRGKMTWGSSSPDVMVEGNGVVRFADLTHHNCNTFNVVHIQGGSLTWVQYGDEGKCPLCDGKVHEPTFTKDKSNNALADCDALISQLRGQPDQGLRVKTDPDTGVVTRSGYMVGVVVTQCGKKYAACSGARGYGAHKAFADAAKGAGLIPCVESGMDSMTKAMNAIVARRDGPLKPSVLTAKVTKLVKDTNQKDGNPPGQCAAPRAISAALNDQHVPLLLCEKWYGPAGAQSTTVLVKSTLVQRYTVGDGTLRPTARGAEHIERGHGSAVPSCSTCQNLVPVLLCYTRGEKCH